MIKDSLIKIDSIKSVLDSYRPFPDHVAKQIRDYYRIGLTYTSNAIEGNTLTESETKVIIEDGLTIGGKSLKEHFEVTGHAKAYDHIHTIMGKHLAEEDLLSLHKLIFQNIDSENAGRYRNTNVIITGTDFLPPVHNEVPMLMEKHISKLNSVVYDMHPLEWASNLHAEFESIHPFIDGNGRIGRLLLSILSMKNGYCPVIIPPIRRSEYIFAIREANKGKLTVLKGLIINIIYEEMKSLKRLIENLFR
jgi:Fic family protein